MSQGTGNERTPESADFAGRIRAPRRRPPIAVLGWVAVLGAIVALGLSGQPTQSGATSPATAAPGTDVARAGAASASQPRPSYRLVGDTTPPRFDPDFPTFSSSAGIWTSPPGPINLQASRHPSTVFVHGDVFAQQVTWVFVSLQSLDGQVGGWA